MLRGLLLQTTIFKNMSLNNVTLAERIPRHSAGGHQIPVDSTPSEIASGQGVRARFFVDRFMTTAMHYPTNYGLCSPDPVGDGDPVDVLVITPYPCSPAWWCPAAPWAF